jgi:hypothetical protein
MINFTELIAFHETKIAESSCTPVLAKTTRSNTCQIPEPTLHIFEKFCGRRDNIQPDCKPTTNIESKSPPYLRIYNTFCADPDRIEHLFPPRKLIYQKSYQTVYQKPRKTKKKCVEAQPVATPKDQETIHVTPQIKKNVKIKEKKITSVLRKFRSLFKPKSLWVSPSCECIHSQ